MMGSRTLSAQAFGRPIPRCIRKVALAGTAHTSTCFTPPPTAWASHTKKTQSTGSSNGNVGSVDRYDFKEPHIAGGHDHSDGEIHRYIEGELKRVERVPSHMAFGSFGRMLYIADTGNKRIIRLDTSSGTEGSRFSPTYDELAVSNYVNDAELVEIVAPGTLELPSGLAITSDTMYVTDGATSMIYAFDLDGNLLNQLNTRASGRLTRWHHHRSRRQGVHRRPTNLRSLPHRPLECHRFVKVRQLNR